MNTSLIIFTDLDGCLLNKTDYSYAPALPVLDRIEELGVPLILCSSKTQAEMKPLAEELNLPYPIICENGGLIVWRDERPDTILGTPRSAILKVLEEAHQQFKFRSFTDLGVDGIMETTDLPREKAERANQRQCNEPLLWDDDPARIDEFRELLTYHKLHFSKGGRFWHVTGTVNKGVGLKCVLDAMNKNAESEFVSVAIGDSPIDQPMLEIADIAISIPQPSGEFLLDFSHTGLKRASQPGSLGWAETVASVLDERF